MLRGKFAFECPAWCFMWPVLWLIFWNAAKDYLWLGEEIFEWKEGSCKIKPLNRMTDFQILFSTVLKSILRRDLFPFCDNKTYIKYIKIMFLAGYKTEKSDGMYLCWICLKQKHEKHNRNFHYYILSSARHPSDGGGRMTKETKEVALKYVESIFKFFFCLLLARPFTFPELSANDSRGH
jgi:hypothetical protein